MSRILYSDGPNIRGGFDLRWARGPQADGSFHRESVDPGNLGISGNPSMAVGPSGRSYVSYVVGLYWDEGQLRYATRGADGWSLATVDPEPSTSLTAIAVGTDGEPVIAYTKTDGQVRIARHTASGWVTSPVTQEQRAPTAVDVAVGPAGRPRIAYIVWDDSAAAYVLKLATLSGSTWSIQTVGRVSIEGIEFDVDLLIDSAGRSLLVFPAFVGVQGLDLARRTPSGWRLMSIAKGNLWDPTAALDPTGHLHVVFYGATAGALRYAVQSGGHWALSTIADSPSPYVRIGRQSSVAIDDDGQAHVSYYVGKASNGTTLHYAASTGRS